MICGIIANLTFNSFFYRANANESISSKAIKSPYPPISFYFIIIFVIRFSSRRLAFKSVYFYRSNANESFFYRANANESFFYRANANEWRL